MRANAPLRASAPVTGPARAPVRAATATTAPKASLRQRALAAGPLGAGIRRPAAARGERRVVMVRAQAEKVNAEELAGRMKHHLTICRNKDTPPAMFRKSATELGRLLVLGGNGGRMAPPEVLAALSSIRDVCGIQQEKQRAELGQALLAEAEQHLAEKEVEIEALRADAEALRADAQRQAEAAAAAPKLPPAIGTGVVVEPALKAFTDSDYVSLHAYLIYKARNRGRDSTEAEKLQDWQDAEAVWAQEVAAGADRVSLFRRYQMLCAELILGGDELLTKSSEDAVRLRSLGSLIMLAHEKPRPKAGAGGAAGRQRVDLPPVHGGATIDLPDSDLEMGDAEEMGAYN